MIDVIISFINRGHYGQGLYIDNINLQSTTAVAHTQMFNTPSLQISPNPASMQFNVGINGSNKNDRWAMQITDYLGKSVMQKDINGGG
ncbi:MAG: hypothetical protein ACK56I_12365, partial [bacterium]